MTSVAFCHHYYLSILFMYYFVQEFHGSESKTLVHTNIFANFDAAKVYAQSLLTIADHVHILHESNLTEPVETLVA